MSEGEYATMGVNEEGDLQCVINYVRQEYAVEKIALWGRSMGAVVGLMWMIRDGEGHCERKQLAQNNNSDQYRTKPLPPPPIVDRLVLDSPFSDLRRLLRQIAQQRSGFPSFMFGPVLSEIEQIIKAKLNINILNELCITDRLRKVIETDNLRGIKVLLLASQEDRLVRYGHALAIKEVLGEERCELISLMDGHNEPRANHVKEKCAAFINSCGVSLGQDQAVSLLNNGSHQNKQPTVSQCSTHNVINHSLGKGATNSSKDYCFRKGFISTSKYMSTNSLQYSKLAKSQLIDTICEENSNKHKHCQQLREVNVQSQVKQDRCLRSQGNCNIYKNSSNNNIKSFTIESQNSIVYPQIDKSYRSFPATTNDGSNTMMSFSPLVQSGHSKLIRGYEKVENSMSSIGCQKRLEMAGDALKDQKNSQIASKSKITQKSNMIGATINVVHFHTAPLNPFPVSIPRIPQMKRSLIINPSQLLKGPQLISTKNIVYSTNHSHGQCSRMECNSRECNRMECNRIQGRQLGKEGLIIDERKENGSNGMALNNSNPLIISYPHNPNNSILPPNSTNPTILSHPANPIRHPLKNSFTASQFEYQFSNKDDQLIINNNNTPKHQSRKISVKQFIRSKNYQPIIFVSVKQSDDGQKGRIGGDTGSNRDNRGQGIRGSRDIDTSVNKDIKHINTACNGNPIINDKWRPYWPKNNETLYNPSHHQNNKPKNVNECIYSASNNLNSSFKTSKTHNKSNQILQKSPSLTYLPAQLGQLRQLPQSHLTYSSSHHMNNNHIPNSSHYTYTNNYNNQTGIINNNYLPVNNSHGIIGSQNGNKLNNTTIKYQQFVNSTVTHPTKNHPTINHHTVNNPTNNPTINHSTNNPTISHSTNNPTISHPHQNNHRKQHPTTQNSHNNLNKYLHVNPHLSPSHARNGQLAQFRNKH